MSHRIACIGSINKIDVLFANANHASQIMKAPYGKKISYFSTLKTDVPGGFTVTSETFNDFLECNGLTEWINVQLDELDINDANQLTNVAASIRQKILHGCMPEDLAEEISFAYKMMIKSKASLPVVEISSAITADGIAYSFFNEQQLTFFNMKGVKNIIDAIKHMYASLYNERIIAERVKRAIPADQVAIAVTIESMESEFNGHEKDAQMNDVNTTEQFGYYSPTHRLTVQL